MWKEIPGFPGYEVSFGGRLRDLSNDGDAALLKHSVGPCGFHTLNLARMGKGHHQVGKLVALAWIGPRPDGAWVRYLDGNLQNHSASNLAYGTREEFFDDQAYRARREEAAGALTHCAEGHQFSDRWFGGWGERLCVPCRNIDAQARLVSRLIQDKPCHKCGDLMIGVPYQRHLCEGCSMRVSKLRDKPCEVCGDLMVQVSYQRKKCPPCRHGGSLKGTVQDKKCQDCSAELGSVNYQKLLCDECKSGRLKQSQRKHLKGPRVSRCFDCSAEIVSTSSGPVPKRCPEHKAQAIRANVRRCDQKRRRRVPPQ